MAKNYHVRMNHLLRRLAEMEIRTRKKIPAEAELKPDEAADVAELCGRLQKKLNRKKNAAWGDLIADVRKIIRTATIDFKTQSALMDACTNLGIIRNEGKNEK